MPYFDYQDGILHAEQVSLSGIAERFGTPCYVYSRAAVESAWKAYDEAFADRRHLVCYAVKANSNIAVLNLLARLGSGFDIVSVGELERVIRAGGAVDRTIFSGVGKQRHEMARALELGIRCFNVESEPELLRLNEIAGEHGRVAPVSLRINPDIDAGTHPYIATGLNNNKFGIPFTDALAVYKLAQDLQYIEITGIACHIGSQITSSSPHIDAIRRLLDLVNTLQNQGMHIRHIDVGGGLGIRYRDEKPPSRSEFVSAICSAIPDPDLEIQIEPGRSITGEAGVLLTRIEYLKQNGNKHFAVVDAAMNDLLRPALYDAWQEVMPVQQPPPHAVNTVYDVVGPVCETGDFLALDRQLAVQPDDLLVICTAGAYGFCMSSNYNSRPRAAELMVDGVQVVEIRRREDLQGLMAGEALIT